MKIINRIANILHKIGIHFWDTTYGDNERSRICKICKKQQIYEYDGAVSGMADFGYWKTIV